MNPKLWQAIDRIGSRKASRFEWETVSGLPWPELSPFLRTAGGQAVEVPDPDAPDELLVVWPKADGVYLLESQEIPAHRSPLPVERSHLVLHRVNLDAITARLAEIMNFTAQPVTRRGPLLTIGFVQAPGARKTEVHLFVPSTDPHDSHDALAHFDSADRILLIPTARWASILPPATQTRELAAFFHSHSEDYLVNLQASPAERSASPGLPKGPVVCVRQDDVWEDVIIGLNADAHLLRVRIGEREGTIPLKTARGKFTKIAEVFALIAAQDPPRWSNSDFSESERGARRKAFQRFCRDLRSWIPVNDGHPFREDRSQQCHFPKFKCEPLRARLK